LLFIFFFARSIDENRSLKTGLVYAIAAGLSLGYLCTSWGASRYPIVMTALFALVLLVTRRYSQRLLLSYTVTFLLALSIAASIPYLGTRFLFEIEILPVYGVLFLLCIAEINRRTETPRDKMIYGSLLIGLLAVFLLYLWSKGMIGRLETKFLAVINPFLRTTNPLVESVSEHRPSAWGTFYYNFGIGVFFVPVGLFFATMMATNLSIFMIIYGLTSIFFASSMIRLNIIMSPSLSLLWALAIVRLLKPFILFLKEPSQPTRRKMRFRGVIGKETVAAILIMMFILFTLTYVTGTDFVAGPKAKGPRVFVQAFSPTTIASSSMSAKPSSTVRDWIDTLIWMRENDEVKIVASWWDYGYWITAIANKTSLADNATFNRTQIQQIGKMFMSNETEAIQILKKYDVTHVLVFTTFDTRGRLAMAGGDEGKWEWMAKIPGPELVGDYKSFGNYTLGIDWIDRNNNDRVEENELVTNSKGQNTVLYKLMTYGREMTIQGASTIQLEHFKEAYFSREHGSPDRMPEPAPGTSYIPLVCVYKVIYD